MRGPLSPPSLLQTSTSARRWLSRVGQALAASTPWAPTRARGTRCSVGVATMPARMGPSVWVRPATSLPAFHPAWGFLGSSVRGRPWPRGSLGLRVPCSPSLADVNECETGVHQCGEGQVCHNLPGSYRCDCKPGFQRDAFGRACVGRWALVAGNPSVVSTCPGPAPGQPSSRLLPPAGPVLRLALLFVFALVSSASLSMAPSPFFLASCCVCPSLCLCLQPPSNTLPAFLLGPWSCCLSCSLSRFLPVSPCGSLCPRPHPTPLLPGGGGSWLPGPFCPPFGPPTPCLPPARRRERVLDLAGPPVPAHV